MEKVSCIICSKELYNNWIIRHVNKEHSMSMQDYYHIIYPHSNKNCLFCNKLLVFKGGVAYHGGYGYYCNHSCKGKYHGNRIMSNNHKIYPDMAELAGKESQRKCPNKASETATLMHKRDPTLASRLGKIGGRNNHILNPETARNTAIRLINDNNSNFGKRKGTRSYYKGILMRSTWEVEFAQLCDQHNIEWQYEPKWFKLPNGKRYLPDFYLQDKDLWVEIKPKKFQTESVLSKGRDLGINYLVLDMADFKEFIHDLA